MQTKSEQENFSILRKKVAFYSFFFPINNVEQDKSQTLSVRRSGSDLSRAPDKDHFLFSRMPMSSPNTMFDHLLESSHRDDSNKLSNIEFGEDITQVELIEVNFTNLICSSAFQSTILRIT